NSVALRSVRVGASHAADWASASTSTTAHAVPAAGAPTSGAPPANPPPSSPQATPVCQARLAQYAGGGNPWHVSLVAAYASTAADVAADDEHRHPGHPSAWRQRPPREFEAVCWFDAEAFGAAPGARVPAGGGNFYDRLEEIVPPDRLSVVYHPG